MNIYQLIESLRITLQTFQLDPRRDESHPLHQSWVTMVDMFQEQLDKALEDAIPDIIKSIPSRIRLRNQIRILLSNMINQLTDDNVTLQNLTTIYLDSMNKLGQLLHQNGSITGLSTSEIDDLIDYLLSKNDEISAQPDTDRSLKIVGKSIKQITDLLGINIDDDSEGDDEIDEGNGNPTNEADEEVNNDDNPNQVDEESTEGLSDNSCEDSSEDNTVEEIPFSDA